MSKSGKSPLENAVEIIEKFGGIRPMASKTGVAVTTIQGWKKRGVIPGARKGAILDAAQEHEVDLFGLVEGAPSLAVVEEEPEQVAEAEAVSATDVVAELISLVSEDNENAAVSFEEDDNDDSSDDEPEAEDKEEEPKEKLEEDNGDDKDEAEVEADVEAEEKDDEDANDKDEDEGDKDEEEDDLEIPVALRRTVEAESAKRKTSELRADRAPNGNYAEFTLETKKGAMNRSMIIAIAILLLILAALAGVILPKNKSADHRDARIEELEKKLLAVRQEQSSFKGLMPENWSDELAQLKRQAEQVKQGISHKVDDVKALSHDLASAQGITNRVEQLQTYVSEISGETGVYALKSRFDKMRQDYMGEKTLSNSVQALLPIIQRSKGANPEHLNVQIANARTQDKSLQTSLGNVPQKELKAAAMLLAMTQVRSALNRPETEFDGDLQLLMGMVSDDNTELKAAIEKLAPYSKEGVLTPSGVKSEFQTVAGEAVAASLRGEDVSVSDKLSAKFNELLKVEKDGELLTGTETQATINTAENLVEEDRFEDAVVMLKKKLRAKELKPLQPWIKKAEGLVASKKLGDVIDEAIDLNFGSGLLGGKVLENRNH